MIKLLVDLLHSNEFYGASENIEIAKGKNKLYYTVKEKKEQNKRLKEWQLKKQ